MTTTLAYPAVRGEVSARARTGARRERARASGAASRARADFARRSEHSPLPPSRAQGVRRRFVLVVGAVRRRARVHVRARASPRPATPLPHLDASLRESALLSALSSPPSLRRARCEYYFNDLYCFYDDWAPKRLANPGGWKSWEESDRQRDRRYDDDDDHPVFRGNRNYEGVGVGVGEALGDMATAVKRTTDRMIEEAKKSEMASRLGNQVEQITKDVRGEGKSQGGCFTSAPCLPVATGSPRRLPSTRARRWLGRRRQGEEHVEYARGVLLRHARVDVSTAQGPREVAAVARLHAARGEGAGAG